MKEIWKNVKNYEGLYLISNSGKIKSLPRKGTKGKILKPQTNKKGYLVIRLYKNSKFLHIGIARLVAINFIPNLSNLKTVNHKDGNKLNNFSSNLEWLSSPENTKHWCVKLKCKGSNSLKLNNQLVSDIRASEISGKELSGKFSVSPQTICDIRHNRTWKYI